MSLTFRDFIVRDAIVCDMKSDNKLGAITELVDALIDAEALTEELRPGVVSALMAREGISTTAIGGQIAIPHGKHPGVHKLMGVFGHSYEGVPFDAADGEPVKLFFLLLSNQTETSSHLEALAYISRSLSNDLFRKFLLNSRSTQEVMSALDAEDEEEYR